MWRRRARGLRRSCTGGGGGGSRRRHPASRAIACDAPHDVLTRLDDLLEPGDVLLFKVLRALALEQIISQLQAHRAEMFESKSADAVAA